MYKDSIDTFAGLPDISLTQPDMLIKCRVSEDRFAAEVLVPGFAYTDFDQKIGGKLSLWSILKIVEGARWRSLLDGFVHYPEMTRDQTKAIFVVNQTLYFDKGLHDIRKGNAYGVEYPMRFFMTVSDIGKTSFTVRVRWVDSSGKETLGTFVSKIVYFDRTLRKSIPLPKAFLERKEVCNRNTSKSTGIPRSEPMAIPETAFRYQTRVLHSDTDLYHHANQASFIRWASDAAALAAIQGNLPNFKSHVERYPVKYMEMQYFGEVVVNDEVTVFVKNFNSNPLHLYIIMKFGKTVVFSLKMEFYDGPPAAVSPHLQSRL